MQFFITYSGIVFEAACEFIPSPSSSFCAGFRARRCGATRRRSAAQRQVLLLLAEGGHAAQLLQESAGERHTSADNITCDHSLIITYIHLIKALNLEKG